MIIYLLSYYLLNILYFIYLLIGLTLIDLKKQVYLKNFEQ